MSARRKLFVLSILGPVMLTGLTLSAAAAPAGATPSYCGIRWGSLPKSVLEYSDNSITDVRVGRHDCYDRFVIDVSGMPAPGYDVRYIDALRNQDTGAVVPVAGGAILRIRAHAHGETLPWTWATHIKTPGQFSSGGYRTFRDVVYAGTYEGSTDFALGVRGRLPFRVFPLDGPGAGSRLVIDVAHRW